MIQQVIAKQNEIFHASMRMDSLYITGVTRELHFPMRKLRYLTNCSSMLLIRCAQLNMMLDLLVILLART